MEFNVVEIPVAQQTGLTSEVTDALSKNIGKAIELELGEKDSNVFRKTIRAGLSNRGLLTNHRFRTRVDYDRKVMIAWLEAK